MKKIIMSLVTVSALAIVGIAATGAFFSDEEKSTGNTFQAGAIDLQVDYEGYYNKAVDRQPNAGSWTLKDLTSAEKFFDFSDVKPGDYGEGTISLHVTSNPYWACVNITPTLNDDVTTPEPELAAGDVVNTDSIFDGELAQNMQFKIWADDGDNIWQDGEPVLTQGTGPITPRSWAIADSVTGGVPLNPNQTYYLGVSWTLPNTVGNIVQTDKYMADISFYVEQSRNNDGFKCPIIDGGTPTPETSTLRLENEREVQGGPWEVIVDEKYVDMTYNTSGATFDYTLNGKGLAASTEYALIYYADGWPGNNPGALIGKHTTDAGGLLNVALTSKELGMNLPTLPDGNFAIGAKIWLIPSSAYNKGTNSVTVWPPDFNTWFFEGNNYINYTNI